jgi:XTP/dITP diphosphohydrolase
MAKARHFFGVAGMPTIADDSGLAVDALGGAPGVRSKRWSGRFDLEGQELDDANNAKLLAEMSDVTERGARYVCVAAYVDGERELMARGECAGEVLREGRGSNGFGYDPYFLSYDLGVTFGESGVVEKEGVSHRGRALQRLMEYLRRGR